MVFGIGPHVALAVSESIQGTLDRIGIRGVWRLSKHLGRSVVFLESLLISFCDVDGDTVLLRYRASDGGGQ